jgi:hypothetical protein
LAARLEAQVAELMANPAFAEARRAVVEGRIDPYEAADRFLAPAGGE